MRVAASVELESAPGVSISMSSGTRKVHIHNLPTTRVRLTVNINVSWSVSVVWIFEFEFIKIVRLAEGENSRLLRGFAVRESHSAAYSSSTIGHCLVAAENSTSSLSRALGTTASFTFFARQIR